MEYKEELTLNKNTLIIKMSATQRGWLSIYKGKKTAAPNNWGGRFGLQVFAC